MATGVEWPSSAATILLFLNQLHEDVNSPQSSTAMTMYKQQH